MNHSQLLIFSTLLLPAVCFGADPTPNPIRSFPANLQLPVPEVPELPSRAVTQKNAPPSDNFAGKSTKIDSVLVSVDGDPITLLDVILETAHAERELSAMFSGERLLSETSKLRRETVEDLVLRKLVYQLYLKKPFPIPNQEIETMLDGLARDLGDSSRESLAKKAVEFGSNIDEIRKKAKEKIAVEALLSFYCDRRAHITPREIYEEYRASPADSIKPERIGLQQIQILKADSRSGSDTAETIEKISASVNTKYLDSVDFAIIVSSFSDAPSRNSGGFIDPLSRDELRPEFAEALKNKSSIGTIVGPVETPEAFYFLRISSIEKESAIPFDSVSMKIRQHLLNKAIKQYRAEFSRELRKNAIIRYYF